MISTDAAAAFFLHALKQGRGPGCFTVMGMIVRQDPARAEIRCGALVSVCGEVVIPMTS